MSAPSLLTRLQQLCDSDPATAGAAQLAFVEHLDATPDLSAELVRLVLTFAPDDPLALAGWSVLTR